MPCQPYLGRAKSIEILLGLLTFAHKKTQKKTTKNTQKKTQNAILEKILKNSKKAPKKVRIRFVSGEFFGGEACKRVRTADGKTKFSNENLSLQTISEIIFLYFIQLPPFSQSQPFHSLENRISYQF